MPRRIPCSARVAFASIAFAAAAPPHLLDGYRGPDEIVASARSLAANHAGIAAVRTLGRSREGREIVLLTVGSATEGRPALLIVAGLDGTHALGPELALRAAERLASEHAELLGRVTVHVVPMANPDALAATRRGPAAVSTTSRPVDDDRDGGADEDPPVDLDGDGAILLMRIKDPPPPYLPTLVVDDKDQRLLRAPDPLKGERAEYLLLTEAIDADGDGRFGEDGPGGVDLDRNFPHRWPEFAPDAGPFQISEPEAKLLADFVIETPELLGAIVYGRHDTLIAVPDTRDMDATGRTPMVYLAADHAIYQELGKVYRESTGQSRASAGDPSGSFWIWLANHRGLTAVAANGWGRPDAPPKPAEDGAPAEETKQAEAAAPQPPEAGTEAPGPRGGGAQRRGGRGPGGRAAPAQPRQESRPVDTDLADWIDYLERERGGAGYAAWRPIEHPFFGTVEVGGVDPLAKRNPPAAALPELAEKQAAFLIEWLGRFPAIEVRPPTVTKVGPSLWRVETSVVNVGRLPTHNRMARTTRAIAPIVARVSVPLERVAAGDRVRIIDGLDPGERVDLVWLLRADPSETIELSIGSPSLGQTRYALQNGAVSAR